MPRALVMQRSIVPPGDRKEYLAGLRDKQAYYARVNCRFWAFEEAGLPGAFLEFIEGPDVATLAAAQSRAPEPPRDPGRIYQEVELS
jgi:hypothetical protein